MALQLPTGLTLYCEETLGMGPGPFAFENLSLFLSSKIPGSGPGGGGECL